MRLAVVGKGGSGKTVMAGLLANRACQQGWPVLAIDADINQTLGSVLGLPDVALAALPSLGTEQNFLKDHIRGDNLSIMSNNHIVKTTPPGSGSGFVTFAQNDPVLNHYAYSSGNLRFIKVGGFEQSDIGTHCYHSKTGAVELLLNHLQDDQNDLVVVDMTAGADAFASGLFTRFDITLLMVEPTFQSVSVYRQYKEYAAKYQINIRVVGNKIHDQADRNFIVAHTADDLIGYLTFSPFIKARDRGEAALESDIEPENVGIIDDILSLLCAHKRNWNRYWSQAISFHLKNAESWANAYTGVDLSKQIQKEYLEKWTA